MSRRSCSTAMARRRARSSKNGWASGRRSPPWPWSAASSPPSICSEVPPLLIFATCPAQPARGCDVDGTGMTSHPEILEACSFVTIARAVVAVCALCLVTFASAQEVRPPGEIPSQPSGEPAANPPAAPAPNSVSRPGFVDAIGHWFNEGTTKCKADLQGAQATFDQLGKETRDAAKDATDAVVGLPNARMVTLRERCAVAQNGAPDCQAAAAAA